MCPLKWCLKLRRWGTKESQFWRLGRASTLAGQRGQLGQPPVAGFVITRPDNSCWVLRRARSVQCHKHRMMGGCPRETLSRHLKPLVWRQRAGVRLKRSRSRERWRLSPAREQNGTG
jgi:hypothetical protein